jgi:ribosomal protein S6--L-glutamate ligase
MSEICLIRDRREHPVLAATLELLAERHRVRVLEMPLVDGDARELASPADVYLLKSRDPHALELARALEERGAAVINSTRGTAACRDRVVMAELLTGADLSAPATQPFETLRSLRERGERGVTFPAMLKSRHSRRGDLVLRVDDEAALAAVPPVWDDEPVVLQSFVRGSGWDVKLWVIDREVHAAKRLTPLVTGATGDEKKNVALAPGEFRPEWRELALRIGDAFGLTLYGVDVLPTGEADLVIDVNAFPGFRSVPGAPAALAAAIEAHAPAKAVLA